MSYTPYYPNGWQSGKTGNTPIIPEALQHMEQGIMDSAPDGFGLGRKGVGTLGVECDTEAKLDLLVFNGFWAYRNSEVPLIPGDDFTKFVKGFTLAYNDFCATQIGFCTSNGRCIIREMYGETPGMWGDWGYPTAAFGAAAASHKHNAGDITGGAIPITRGGTGATTAAEARANLGITRAILGAAPDGFGLGELGKGNLDIICTTKAQLDAKMLNGFWSYGNETEPLIPGDAYTYFVKGITLAYSTGAVTQIGVCNANGEIIIREFYQPPEQEGKWGDWRPLIDAIGAAPTNHSHSASSITDGVLPIPRGGTGGATPEAARAALGITLANLGAAPDGFGLGELGKGNLDIICPTKAQLDAKMRNGFWSYGNETEPLIPGDAYTYYVKGITLAYSTGAVTQIGVCNANGGIIIREFYQPPEEEGKWDEWCYLNPPMAVGVEYRTTERSGALPVYAKRISQTVLQNYGSTTAMNELYVPHGVANFARCVRCIGTRSTYQLPIFDATAGGFISIDRFNADSIVLKVNKMVIPAGAGLTFDFYYTKKAQGVTT